MEQNTIQWLRSPSFQRGSYSFYKWVSCRADPAGPLQVWRLGEFYYVRPGPQEPVCIAEVTLLWEEQVQHPLLASCRLYFAPEDTPKGRTWQHGEDEVLAVCKRIVVPLEDLVRWACPQPVGGRDQKGPSSPPPVSEPPRGDQSGGATAEPSNTPLGDQGGGTKAEPTAEPLGDQGGGTKAEPTAEPLGDQGGGTKAEPTAEPLGDQGGGTKAEPDSQHQASGTTAEPASAPLRDQGDAAAAPGAPQGVKVLSYPQYCRFRSLKRRLQDRAGPPGGADPHLRALGGLRVALSNTRVMYCRETFTHPTLDALWPNLRCPSLSSRGRPRKKKTRDARETPTLTRSQSESWSEKMKEDMMGSVDSSPERAWLAHPEEQLFLDQLFVFMERFGRPINKVPNLGFKKIDLFRMYSVVQGMGGYEKVTSERLWKVVYNDLGGCPGSTSAATCTRRHYERLMLRYEEHVRAGGEGLKLPESPAPTRLKGVRGKKPLPRGRKPGAKAKESGPPAKPPPAVNPDGTAVVKRGRGRPPGRRNKATLLAQAKLLAQQQAKAKAGVSSPAPASPAPGPAPPPPPPPAPTHTVQSPSPKPPAHAPLTPDLSPRTAPLLPFHTKPGPQGVQGIQGAGGDPPGPPGQPALLGPYSPSKGVCPLDAFRTRPGLRRAAEDPAPHGPVAQSLQSGAEPRPHPQACSGCVADEGGAQRGVGREGKARPPLPPLRVFPLDLDCSVQVRQLMRTPLGAVQLECFTRRLSQVLAQDLRVKGPLPPRPCSPITPPPEQAQPLNLSQRSPPGKRPAALSLDPAAAAAKRPRGAAESPGRADGEDPGPDGGGWTAAPPETQEEPADLSSPSRIRAFLMGLPAFHVNLEDHMTSLPVPPPDHEEEEEEPMQGVGVDEDHQRQDEEERAAGSKVTAATPPAADDAMRRREEEEGGENSGSLSAVRGESEATQEVAADQQEVRREDFPAQGLARTLQPAVLTQHS